MSRPSVDDNAVAALITTFVKLIAPELAREVAKHLSESRGDDLVSRSTCPISKRAWDRAAGKRDGFAAFRDGRRVVARRADVLGWLERARAIKPGALDLDADDVALENAGVKLSRSRRAVSR